MRRSDAAPRDEVPPAVAAARASLQSESVTEPGWILVNDAPGSSTDAVVDRERTPRAIIDQRTWISHSGETLVRRRNRAPWTPSGDRPARGSSDLAYAIARSGELTHQAEEMFQALIYAPSTSAGKEALFGTWRGLCEARGELPLPVTDQMMMTNTAILRSAGYRAAMSYVYEAKSRHIRAGYQWTPRLQTALTDCKRAATRGLGEVQRSAEIPLEAWEALILAKGTNPQRDRTAVRGPSGGVQLWILGSLYLLREIELGCLHLDANCIKLDETRELATLKLPVSKTDPSGRGSARTLGCCCKGLNRDWLCPFHTLSDLVTFRLMALNYARLEDVPHATYTLVGQKGNPALGVEKYDMITEAQRHATLAVEMTNYTGLKVDDMTGHFMRRSGIKSLARKGCSFSSIQWVARHSSSVTWQYIEESWSENPQESLRLRDDLAMVEMMTSTLARVTLAEEAVSTLQKNLSDSLKKDGFPAEANEDLRQLITEEIKRSLMPKFVINSHSKVVHSVCKTSCLRMDPKTWTTVCGWGWVNSSGVSQPCYEEEDLPVEVRECHRCFYQD